MDDNHVEVAVRLAGGLEHGLELRAIIVPAACACIDELSCHRPVMIGAELADELPLGGDGYLPLRLAAGRNAEIHGGATI